jgi:uncharacterized protein YciI
LGYRCHLESLLITHFGDLVTKHLVGIVLLVCAVLSAQDTAKQAEPQKFVPETFYMALLRRAEPYDANKVASFANAQRSYWDEVAEKGNLVASGPITSVKDTLAAVMIFRAPDLEAAKKVVQGDPIVHSGLWTNDIHPWLTQKDVLPSLKSYDPATYYYLGFLRRGAKFSSEDSPERQKIQEGHMANIRRLGAMGKLIAAGPFTDDGDLRGIFVFKTATREEADELTNTDPAVKAGRLRIDLYSWEVPAEAFPKPK